MQKIKRIKKILKVLLWPFIELFLKKDGRRSIIYTYYYKRSKVSKNIIFYESYHGNNISCNPYALYSALSVHPEFSEFRHVWAVADMTMEDRHKLKGEVEFVEVHSRKYLKSLTEAKYLINNNTFPSYFQKKEGQVYINTWHGTPLKTLGMDIKNVPFTEHKNVQRNFLHTDYLIVPNEYTATKLLSAYDVGGLFEGEILDFGYPRVDLTLSCERSKLKGELSLSETKKIILYAPTWRGGINSKEDTSEIVFNDYLKLKEGLPENCILLLKAHHITQIFFEKRGMKDYCVPSNIDTNELLSITDLLITDYSSIFFDYLCRKKPIIFYANDWESYNSERGFYINLDELPGPVFSGINEVIRHISNIDRLVNDFSHSLEKASLKFAYNDDGKATERSISEIFQKRFSSQKVLVSQKKKILMYCGGFNNNGITIAALNLLDKIDYDKYEVAIVDYNVKKKDNIENLKKINPNVKILYRVGNWNRGILEYYLHHFILRKGIYNKLSKLIVPKSLYQREFKRLVGNTKIDIAIDYGGYSGFWALIFAFNSTPKKNIYLHNDMWQEYNKIINGVYRHKQNLNLIFSLYDYFDSVVSVAESTMEENKLNLRKIVNDPEKMVFANNIVNAERVLEGKLTRKVFEFENSKYLITESGENLGEFFLKSIKLPEKKNVNFINVGRLSPEKDQEKLILAFNELYKENSNIRLYIVGEGPLEKELKELVRNLNLDQVAFFAGHLKNPFPLIEACDCFVLSSNYEGQGLVLFESMILQKSVIATNVTGVRSVLEIGGGKLIDNNQESVLEGMRQFLNGEVKPSYFNVELYNSEALEMFYDKVCT